MHEPVLVRLEEYLDSGEPTAELESHLKECAECRKEVELMRMQSLMFDSLKAPVHADPAPGFYARVMAQVDSQVKPSVWSLFGESLFAKRLAYASATLMVLMGTYLISSQPAEESLASAGPEAILAGAERTGPTIGHDPQRDREAVLVKLATYDQVFQ